MSMSSVRSFNPGMSIKLPKYLIENLPEGAHLLSCDADGRFKVAESSDWVVGIAVNLGMPEYRYIKIVEQYKL